MAKVPKTTGQGTSRASYQSAYRSGQRGTGASGGGDFKPLRTSTGDVKQARGYGKSGGYNAPDNKPYTSEYDPDLVPFGVSNQKTLEGFLPGKPGKPKKGFI